MSAPNPTTKLGLMPIIATGDPATAGEILRSLTFIGEGQGATETTEVRSDAHPWSGEAKEHFYRAHISSHPEQVAAGAQAGTGYTFALGPASVDVFWFPGPDGVIYYKVTRDGAVLRRLATWHAAERSAWEDVTADETVMESADRYDPSAPGGLLNHLRPASVVQRASHLAKRFEREPYWQAEVVILAAIALNVGLTKKLAIGPSWLMPAVEALLLLALFASAPEHRIKRGMPPRSRAAPRIALAVVGLVNMWSLGRLVHELLKGTNAGGRALILAAVVIWLTNVIVFALAFWELDRGGPNDRAEPQSEGPPDFLFVEMASPESTGGDFRPAFIDYLYLSYTNATAFSPTDTMPLGAIPKMLMFVQSLASLVTVGLVASRAVNILK